MDSPPFSMGSIFTFKKKEDFEERGLIKKYTCDEFNSYSLNKPFSMVYPELVAENHTPFEGTISRPMSSMASRIEWNNSIKSRLSEDEPQPEMKPGVRLKPYKLFVNKPPITKDSSAEEV